LETEGGWGRYVNVTVLQVCVKCMVLIVRTTHPLSETKSILLFEATQLSFVLYWYITSHSFITKKNLRCKSIIYSLGKITHTTL